MKVRDLPPGQLLSVDPETSVAEVARRMRMDDLDSVAVMSEERLVGIITERDLVRAIADGLDPQQARADLVMTADPATVDADEEVAMVAVKMMRLGVASPGGQQIGKGHRPGVGSQPGRGPRTGQRRMTR